MSARRALVADTADRPGAHADRDGVHFAVHAPSAERVELCLFDAAGVVETDRLAMPCRTDGTWHGLLPGAEAGTIYGYRAYGPYAPERGDRFNPNKLLVDPLARALVGAFRWDDSVFGYDRADPAADRSFDRRDSAPFVPKGRVVAPMPPRDRPPRPRIPWADTVLCEIHVRGHTRLHPQVPERLRGKLAALAEPAVIDHLRRIGVTTLELMPIAAYIDEYALVRRGLTNYWGYNPLAFCAPHPAYLVDGDERAIPAIVDRLHAAGLEVVLDVVFNHSAETDELGPTLSLRGLDNRAYYRLDPADPRRYADYSGCGNTLDFSRPAAVALALAALRHWAIDVGVDGFRFDLATALGRDAAGDFDANAPLWRAIRDDPDLAGLKLIAEPWDARPSRGDRGGFPPPFVEWNDRYRDAMRRFWRGEAGAVGEFATRLAGSSDLFATRSPAAGIDYVTAHDGPPLADLLSYRDKHNEANGEGNRDGPQENFSQNGGAEGPTAEPAILAARARRARSLLATLLLSRGVPMLLAGDELSRTQRGNDNAYCQDNATSWVDWSALGDPARDRSRFVATMAGLRKDLAVLRADAFLTGVPDAADGATDIRWLRPDGVEMRAGDWEEPAHAALVVLLTGDAAGDTRERVCVAANGSDEELAMRLPSAAEDWLCVIDSDQDASPRTLHAPESGVPVAAGGLLVFVPRTLPQCGVTRALQREADAAGVICEYEDGLDQRRLAAAGTVGTVLECLQREPRPEPMPPARERTRCWIPACLQGASGRWIIATQWYGLHSADSWGIGDFGDIRRLVDAAAAAGASGVMLSPLHAPRLHALDRDVSPYAPSSRLVLNPLCIEIGAIDGAIAGDACRRFLAEPDQAEALARLRAAPLVDHAGAARLKLRALAAIHRAFRERHLGDATTRLGDAFRTFQRSQAAAIRPWALHEALKAARAAGNEAPSRTARIDSPEVLAFAQRRAQQVEFFEFTQWIARSQWEALAAHARHAGLELGLVTDLALGAHADGAESWQWPELVVPEMELGAPADAFAPAGQSWGFPPWHPWRLAREGFRPMVALLEAAMHGAGAVRVDHILGLQRQFWRPRGRAAEGAYVAYPFDAMLEALARCSRERRCMVIGEDLGNVPPGLRERLAEAGVFGYRVVQFERDASGAFLPPERDPRDAAAAFTTHDLPTLRGFANGADLRERRVPDESAPWRERAQTLERLRTALRDHGGGDDDTRFDDAVHRFLAATASRLAIVQLEDIFGMEAQANLPGATDREPNWRQRLPIPIEALAGDARLAKVAGIFAARRRSG